MNDVTSRGAPWLHPALEVRPSAIHGLGLFAVDDVPEGLVVSRLGGTVVTTSDLEVLIGQATLGSRPYVDTISLGGCEHLVLPPNSPSGRGNHSCNPNTWWIDEVTLVARRQISRDEEVTNDYATSTNQEHFRMLCACGEALCRKIITGGDWRRQDLQERYGEQWVPSVLALIRARG